jgi:hypothetical protein
MPLARLFRPALGRGGAARTKLDRELRPLGGVLGKVGRSRLELRFENGHRFGPPIEWTKPQDDAGTAKWKEIAAKLWNSSLPEARTTALEMPRIPAPIRSRGELYSCRSIAD